MLCSVQVNPRALQTDPMSAVRRYHSSVSLYAPDTLLIGRCYPADTVTPYHDHGLLPASYCHVLPPQYHEVTDVTTYRPQGGNVAGASLADYITASRNDQLDVQAYLPGDEQALPAEVGCAHAPAVTSFNDSGVDELFDELGDLDHDDDDDDDDVENIDADSLMTSASHEPITDSLYSRVSSTYSHFTT